MPGGKIRSEVVHEHLFDTIDAERGPVRLVTDERRQATRRGGGVPVALRGERDGGQEIGEMLHAGAPVREWCRTGGTGAA